MGGHLCDFDVNVCPIGGVSRSKVEHLLRQPIVETLSVVSQLVLLLTFLETVHVLLHHFGRGRFEGLSNNTGRCLSLLPLLPESSLEPNERFRVRTEPPRLNLSQVKIKKADEAHVTHGARLLEHKPSANGVDEASEPGLLEAPCLVRP